MKRSPKGRLSAATYQALEQLQQAGIILSFQITEAGH